MMFGAEVLRDLNYQFAAPLYCSNNEHAYFGAFRALPVVFKVRPLLPYMNYNDLENEARILNRTDHKNIVKVYYYHWVLRNAVWYLVVVMEAYNKNLAEDIELRKANHYPYTKEALSDVLVTLVRAFAYMQRLGLAHRDIKPEHIYLSREVLKVGGFGSAKYVPSDHLSPQQPVAHNVFKADVYSLGLTLYALASLQRIETVMQRVHLGIQRAVWDLNLDEEIRRTILMMLTENEEHRLDFVQMEQWIECNFLPTVQLYQEERAPVTVVSEERKRLNESSVEPTLRPEFAVPIALVHPPAPPSQTTPQLSCYELDPLLRNPRQLRCLYCRCNLSPEPSLVQLKCDPGAHVFCSKLCFSKEVERQRNPLRCPSCSSPIEQDDLDWYCVSVPWFGERLFRTIAGMFSYY